MEISWNLVSLKKWEPCRWFFWIKKDGFEWRIHDFPDVGVGANSLLFRKMFGENWIKWKNLDRTGGGGVTSLVQPPPPEPAKGFCQTLLDISDIDSGC